MNTHQNAKRSVYNLLSSLASEIVIVLLGLMVPRLVLVNYGSEVNGLLNTVSQIITYLSLLEAGVGTATLQALYRPVANGNKKDICAIISATDHFYKKTGRIYAVLLIVISLVYPLFIKSELSYGLIFTVIILNGSTAVISYFFQAKYLLLLQAEGKTYISTNLTTVIQIAVSISKVVLILAGFDVIAVQVSYFCISALRVVYIVLYTKRHYTWLDEKVSPDFSAINQKNSVLIHQIAGMIFEHTDVLLLSVVVGLRSVSVYSMYSMIYGMILTVVRSVPGSISFVLGQTYNTDKRKYIKYLDLYEVVYMAFTFAMMTITCILCVPFLKLYTSGVSDVNYLDPILPYLFTIIYLLNNARSSSNMTINCAQHFKKTQNKALLEAGINIIVSIICCKQFGIYGVLFGTIIALLYRTNDVIIYSNRVILKRSPLITYKRWGGYFLSFIIIIICAKHFTVNDASYLALMADAFLYSLIICIIYLMTAFFMEPNILKELFIVSKTYIKSRNNTH